MTHETDVVLGRRALLGGAAALSALAATSGLAACGKEERTFDGPVEVEPGDTCVRCKMHITDMRHVGEILGTKDVWKFDDVGELFIYHQEQGLGDSDVQAIYVKGYDTGKWIEADSARYVIAPDITTPMATHVIALAKDDSVDKYTASESAHEKSYDDLLANPPEAAEVTLEPDDLSPDDPSPGSRAPGGTGPGS